MADVELIDFTIPAGAGHVLYLPNVPGIAAALDYIFRTTRNVFTPLMRKKSPTLSRDSLGFF
jgi:hypothetical protein